MNDINDNFCTLCLNFINVAKFVVIEDIVKDILSVLLLKLNLEENSKHIVCSTCSEKLLAAFEFKSVCIYNETVITGHVDAENMLPLDITNVYMKETQPEELNSTLEDQKVCRFCMELIMGELMFIHETNFDAIQTCVPEINFEVTCDPLICKYCFDSLHTHSDFLTTCSNTHGTIKKEREEIDGDSIGSCYEPYVKSEDVSVKTEEGQQIREEVVIKTEKTDVKFENDRIESLASLLYPKIEAILKSSYYKQHFKSNLAISFSKSKTILKIKYKKKYKRKGPAYKPRRNRSKEKMFKCNDCDFQSRYKRNLENHCLNHKDASQVQMYRCPTCDFQTRHKRNFSQHQHIRSIDKSTLNIYKCKDCHFETRYKKNLNRHLLRHKAMSEQKMYQCKHCDYQSNRRSHVRDHQLNHKDESEVNMFKCSVCDFQTRHKKNLSRHELKHREEAEVQTFQCAVCDFVTRHRENLVRHRLKHTRMADVEMYKCTKCDFQTKYTLSIYRHQLRHKDKSEVELYKCHNCDYQSKYKTNLASHMLIHNRDPSCEFQKCECQSECKCDLAIEEQE